jgi:membrane peptidoglycan carboxypeptidase
MKAWRTRWESLRVFQTPPPPQPQVAAAFINLLLSQLDSRFPRERIERGGLTIISTLDYDLQDSPRV